MVTKVICLMASLALVAGVAVGQETATETAPAPESGILDYQPHLELQIRGWFTDLDAETNFIKNIDGDDVDAAGDLGISGENLPEFILRWQFSDRHALKLSYTQMALDGKETVVKPLWLDGELAGALNRIDSELELKYFRAGWRWTVVDTERLKLDTILDAAVFDAEVRYKLYYLWGLAPAEKDEMGGTAGLPLVGLSLTANPIDRVSLFAELSGMYAGNYGHLLDAQAGGRFYMTKNLFLEGGYRYFRIDAEYDDDDAMIALTGPFAGMGVRF